jgi:prenyltransferase beta subunit
VVGCVAWYNNYIIKKYNEQNSDIQLTNDVKIIIIQNDSLFNIVDRLQQEQGMFRSDMISKLDEVSGTVGIMKNQLGQHIVRTATKEDIINWMQAFEKKNSRWNDGSTSLILCK